MTVVLYFQIHLRDFWDSKYSAMEPSRELTRQLRDSAPQGPSSQGGASAGGEDEEE